MRFSELFQMLFSKSVFAIVLIIGLVCAMPVHAATITVTNGDDSGAGSLRQAIADAQSGDTIVFQDGVTTVTLTSDQLVIDKNLTIDGGGGMTVKRSSGVSTQFRIFYVDSGMTIEMKNIVISDGKALDASWSTGEHGRHGGGIYVGNGGILTLNECSVKANAAGEGSHGSETTDGGDGGFGGGIYVENNGTLTLNNSTVSNNISGNGGDGVKKTRGGPETTNGGDGGSGAGIYVEENGTLTLNNSIVND
ncbi:hypothetical protein [Desulfonema magnum]|nr:hypothetical protein [Desulfonema magnum]